MKRTQAANQFTNLIERQEAEGRNESIPCLMLTGRWYEAFPDPPKASVPLPAGRGIFLLNLKQSRAIRDLLADDSFELEDVEIEIKPKSSPAAVDERVRARERKRIESIVRRTAGRYVRAQLRKGLR